MTSQKERVIQLCKELRLPSVRKMVQEEVGFTSKKQAIDILYQVLTQEKEDRLVRAKHNRIRAANFPQKKLLEDLQEDILPAQAKQKLAHLKDLSFIKEGQNVILTGSPGTGKTHLSIARK